MCQVDSTDILGAESREGSQGFGDLFCEFSGGYKNKCGDVCRRMRNLEQDVSVILQSSIRKLTAFRLRIPWRMGSKYAAVLPEPVFARAKQ